MKKIKFTVESEADGFIWTLVFADWTENDVSGAYLTNCATSLELIVSTLF